MATELICPDCGGVINAPEGDLRQKCTCESDLTMDDTEVEAQPAPPANSVASAPPAPHPAKVCCVCGKDVTNAKRAKDARGYWCYECHRNDLRKERFGDKPRARCPQCGRMVPAESITTYHGDTMCAKCVREQEELPNHMKLKYKSKLQEDPAVAEKEKNKTIVLACVLGAMVVIAVILRLVHVF